MRNRSMELRTVDQVTAHIPGAAHDLRSVGIDPTSRMRLADAAAAVSETPDALLAVMEARMRRAARASVRKEEYAEELALEY